MSLLTGGRINHLQKAYDAFYGRHEQHDSPEKSRPALIQRMNKWLLESEVEHPVVLNLGSGAQMLERQWLRYARNRNQRHLAERLGQTTILTLDFAKIPPHLLRKSGVAHLRADSRALPLRDASVDLAVSNHSIDMLRAEPAEFELALDGVARVLKPGGSVLFNYHPAGLYAAQVAFYRDNPLKRQKLPHNAQYYQGERNPYYEDEASINADLVAAGLVPTGANQVRVLPGNEAWWAVSAQKPSA
jgi:SAM-dependent methyltransferase